MYTLYYNKSEKAIKVSKVIKVLRNLNFTEDVTIHNSYYYICSKRKPLVEKAKEIKQGWILELERDLVLVNQIKI
jgi:hypothetical protein